jgi:hypothetical protein
MKFVRRKSLHIKPETTPPKCRRGEAPPPELSPPKDENVEVVRVTELKDEPSFIV